VASTILEDWTGHDVSISEIEAALAALRDLSGGSDGGPRQRTSVMTHIAWVPPVWLDAAGKTLVGLAARHPSRTVILVPEPEADGGIDADCSVRCFPAGDREVCGEVIELHLRGDRARAPASIVVPLAISDLPLFLRWRGEPPFETTPWLDLVALADRVIVDSSEWLELRFAQLVEVFPRAAVSDIAWARITPWRVALAGTWPEIKSGELTIRGPLAEASLLRGWLVGRLHRSVPPVEPDDCLGVRLDGEEIRVEDDLRTPSDLLSAELDRPGRDPIYEEAVMALASPRHLAA
jgi:hypothetical protein